MFKKGLVTLVCLTVMSALWAWAATTYSISTKITSLGTTLKAGTTNVYEPIIGGDIKVRGGVAQTTGIKYSNFTTQAEIDVVVTPRASYKVSDVTTSGLGIVSESLPDLETGAVTVKVKKPAANTVGTAAYVVATFAPASETVTVTKNWQLQVQNNTLNGGNIKIERATNTPITHTGIKPLLKSYVDTTPVKVTVTAASGYAIDYLIIDGVKTFAFKNTASKVIDIDPSTGSRLKSVVVGFLKKSLRVTTQTATYQAPVIVNPAFGKYTTASVTRFVPNGIEPVNPVADATGSVRLVVTPTGADNKITSFRVTSGSYLKITYYDAYGKELTALPATGPVKVTISGITTDITVDADFGFDAASSGQYASCTQTCHADENLAADSVRAADTQWLASAHKANNIDCVSCHTTMPGPVVAASVDKNTFKVTAESAGTVGSNYCSKCHATTLNNHHLNDSTTCTTCHISVHNPAVAVQAKADNYVGTAVCATCHSAEYATYVKSGHNFKVTKVVNNQIPTYPFSNISGALQNMPATQAQMLNTYYAKPASYSDVTYVVGGYAWKARWMDKGGYLVSSSTGGVQYNLAYPSSNQTIGQGWSTYGSANKKYTCGECHTTGWKYYGGTDNAFKQDNLPGIPGTWVETGVQCEACHGPGKTHAAAPAAGNIVTNASARTQADLANATGYGKAVHCGECHTRDGERNPYGGEGSVTDGNGGWKSAYNNASNTTDTIGGRIRAGALNSPIGGHHQTYDEMFGIDPDNLNAGPMGKHLKAGVSCGTCHNPHATTFYQNRLGNGAGVDVACVSCHDVTFTATGAAHSNADCIVCHMPKLAKSAVNTGPNAAGKSLGDIRTHVMKIDITAASHVAAADGGKFLKPFISRDYACGECHATPATAVASLQANQGGKIHGIIRFKHTNTDGLKPVGDSCKGCHTDGTTAVASLKGPYIGSQACGTCHTQKYTDFRKTGHPYKLQKVVNNTQPTFPFSNIDGRLQEVADNGGTGDLNGNLTDNIGGDARDTWASATYADVSYVIGGFGWKARWIDNSGYVITGSKAQYNLPKPYNVPADTPSWSAYNNNTVTKYDYNCNYCHTTGARHGATVGQTFNPDMPGFGGDDFAYPGVQCEACHGGGAAHAKTGAAIVTSATPRPIADLKVDSGYGDAMACGECHTRDNERLAKNGYMSYFEKYRTDAEIAKFNSDFGGTAMTGLIISNAHGRTSHHEVNEELQGIDPTDVMAGPQGAHKNLKCTDCHNPHKTLAYSAQTGEYPVVSCTDCHNGTAAQAVTFLQVAHASVACKECHMPRLVQNAVTSTVNGWTFGDNRTHSFKIVLGASALPADGVSNNGQRVKITDKDGTGRWYAKPIVTREYACRSCHDEAFFTTKAVDWNTFQVH